MSVKVKIMTIPGAPLEGTNPLPMFHNKNEVNAKAHPDFPAELRVDLGNRSPILPYKMQDRYSRKRLPLKKKTIVMENEYLIATFWPEDGGRLYSLFDKINNAELLMSNPAYQPGNLALRNAWLSGGIEWNFGSYGHHARTCDHLFAAILKDGNNNDFLRMYEFDRTKNTIYQMDFHLPEGSPVLYSHVKMFNPFDEDSTTYWWTNIAIPEDGNTRVLSSTEWAMVLAGSKADRDPVMARIRLSINTVLIPGRMIALNCCHRFAPSMVAASYSVGSMEAMAPMNSTMFWPQYFQTEVNTRDQLLML